jgi:hypothetical protein
MKDPVTSYVHSYILPAVYALLPEPMQSPEASAMLLSIGLQESQFRYRRQQGGPALSFFMFEVAGVAGVRTHPLTREPFTSALRDLRYPAMATPTQLQAVLEHHDVLAAICARLLLWTDPQSMPRADECDRAWDIYTRCWRPGRPRPETWHANYAAAWELVTP